MEERLKYLFTQYLNNRCTKKEFEELFIYIRQSSTDDVLRGLIKKVFEEAGVAERSFTYVDENGNLLLHAPSRLSVEPVIKISRRKKIVFGFSVAAVFIILISVYLSREKNSTVLNNDKTV